MSVAEKQGYFVTNESAEVVNMRSFVQAQGSMKARITAANKKFRFMIDEDIVEILIFGMLNCAWHSKSRMGSLKCCKCKHIFSGSII